jgi:NADH-quinone oxidoreductase subunit J
MSWDAIFFFVLAAASVISAIAMVVAENPVHSAVGLLVSFLNIAGVFVLLGAEFLAVLQVIVYTGAVLVLILFVVMLVDPEKLPSFYVARPLQRYVSLLLGLVLILEIGAAIVTRTALEAIGPHTQEWIANAGGNIQAIGQVLFSEYALGLEVASLVLSVGVVGAVVLGVPERLGKMADMKSATISLGHSRGMNPELPAGPKFESPIDIPAERYSMPEGPRTVVMTKSADEYKQPGETAQRQGAGR